MQYLSGPENSRATKRGAFGSSTADFLPCSFHAVFCYSPGAWACRAQWPGVTGFVPLQFLLEETGEQLEHLTHRSHPCTSVYQHIELFATDNMSIFNKLILQNLMNYLLKTYQELGWFDFLDYMWTFLHRARSEEKTSPVVLLAACFCFTVLYVVTLPGFCKHLPKQTLNSPGCLKLNPNISLFNKTGNAYAANQCLCSRNCAVTTS